MVKNFCVFCHFPIVNTLGGSIKGVLVIVRLLFVFSSLELFFLWCFVLKCDPCLQVVYGALFTQVPADNSIQLYMV